MTEAARAKQAQAVEIAQLHERLAANQHAANIAGEKHAAAIAEAKQAAKEAALAREDAAMLRGHMEALQTQAAELIRALGSSNRDDS